MAKNRFITLEEVLDRVCISKTHLYSLINKGSFPKQVPLGSFKVAFLEQEIDAWIEQRLAAREQEEGAEQRRNRAIKSVSGKNGKNSI